MNVNEPNDQIQNSDANIPLDHESQANVESNEINSTFQQAYSESITNWDKE